MGIEENGGGNNGFLMESVGLNNIKNKYRRMDSPDLSESDNVISDFEAQNVRKSSTKKFVMASAVFASLNSVLLGYGKLVNFFLVFFPFFYCICFF